jgi:hypothetical protein
MPFTQPTASPWGTGSTPRIPFDVPLAQRAKRLSASSSEVGEPLARWAAQIVIPGNRLSHIFSQGGALGWAIAALSGQKTRMRNIKTCALS